MATFPGRSTGTTSAPSTRRATAPERSIASYGSSRRSHPSGEAWREHLPRQGTWSGAWRPGPGLRVKVVAAYFLPPIRLASSFNTASVFASTAFFLAASCVACAPAAFVSAPSAFWAAVAAAALAFSAALRLASVG
jgi:hypothetical protein